MSLVAHGCGGKKIYNKNGDLIERKYEKNKSLDFWGESVYRKDKRWISFESLHPLFIVLGR